MLFNGQIKKGIVTRLVRAHACMTLLSHTGHALITLRWFG
jgi:hypothetical protein